MKTSYVYAWSLLLLPAITLAAGLTIQVNGKSVSLTDVPQNAWYAEHVKAVADAGIMQGYRDSKGKPTGKFGPANPVTRAEFLKMVAVMMAYRYNFDRSGVPTGDHWYETYLRVVQSVDPELPAVMPIDDVSLSQPILRHEAAGLLHLSLGNHNVPPPADPSPFPDVSAESRNYNAITELHVFGVISGDGATGKFNPFRTLNRAEAAKMLVTTASAYQTPLGLPKTEGVTTDTKEGCEAAGGIWKRWDPLHRPWDICNFPTTDSGRACTDIANCQGDCISKDPNASTGTCSEWKQVYDNCIVFLRQGKPLLGECKLN